MFDVNLSNGCLVARGMAFKYVGVTVRELPTAKGDRRDRAKGEGGRKVDPTEGPSSLPSEPAPKATVRKRRRKISGEGAAATQTDHKDVITRLADFIFTRRQQGQSHDDLRADARRDSTLDNFRNEDFLVAFQTVYKTKKGHPPTTGWPLQPAYQARVKSSK